MLPDSNFGLNDKSNVNDNFQTNNSNINNAMNVNNKNSMPQGNSSSTSKNFYNQENKPRTSNEIIQNNLAKNNEKTPEQIQKEAMESKALMAYLGPLVLLPYFQEKENSFILFHVKQGLNLFILEIIVFFVLEILEFLFLSKIFFLASFIEFVCGAFFVGLSVLGMYYVLEGKTKELPIINKMKLTK